MVGIVHPARGAIAWWGDRRRGGALFADRYGYTRWTAWNGPERVSGTASAGVGGGACEVAGASVALDAVLALEHFLDWRLG